MRKPLSMKRLHMLAANYVISTLENDTEADLVKANKLNQTMLDFMKYCWENKNSETLYELKKPFEF